MRMIDGKPEYKNGLVRKLGWWLELEVWFWEGIWSVGQDLRPGPSPNTLPACLGCTDEGHPLRGLLQPVERLYTILCPPGPSHRPHLHLLGADEQGLQAAFPQWLTCMRVWSLCAGAPTHLLHLQSACPWGPGLCFPGPLYLFPRLCDSLLHSKGLWSILFLLPLALLVQIFSLCPWLFLGKGRGS